MFSLFSFTLVFLGTLQVLNARNQEIKSAQILDLVIRNYTFASNLQSNLRTGKLQQINLPSNLSGIEVDAIRLRCGSLQRHGARIKEFKLSSGVNISPCIKRVILMRQSLGSKWSSMYYDNNQLSGYQLISPVLGLLAYTVVGKNSTTTPSELEIQAVKSPILIDFSSTGLTNATLGSGVTPLCASFDSNGKVRLTNEARSNVCSATMHGHFGLVAESQLAPFNGRVSKWRIVTVSSIGGALGAILLSLLVVAMFVKAKKKKAEMDEMERRAYEEEALQVSMVGHVRAVTASTTRTAPTIDHRVY